MAPVICLRSSNAIRNRKIVLLAGTTVVNVLVLVLTQTPFFPILVDLFEGETILVSIVFGLIVVLAIAMVALGYGIGVVGSEREAGRSRHLYLRSREVSNARRAQQDSGRLRGLN
jgi:hypothetical protein